MQLIVDKKISNIRVTSKSPFARKTCTRRTITVRSPSAGHYANELFLPHNSGHEQRRTAALRAGAAARQRPMGAQCQAHCTARGAHATGASTGSALKYALIL